MKNHNVIILFAALFCLIASVAMADPSGTYQGTVKLHQTIPSIEQEVNKSGPAEIVITKQSDDKYDVLIKIKIADLPETDDKNTYTLSGNTLTLSQETNASGIIIQTNGTFTISDDSLTGKVTTTGKTSSDGSVQTTSETTYTASK